MTVDQAVQELKGRGFSDAHFNCGHVWFRNAAGDLFSLTTDYRAQVSDAQLDAIAEHAASSPAHQ